MTKDLKKTISAAQLMVDPVSVIRLNQPIMEAVRKFSQYKIPIIPVINDQDELLGIITCQQIIDRINNGLSLSGQITEMVQKDKFLVFQTGDAVDLDFSFDNYDIICVCDKTVFKGVINIDSVLKLCKWKNDILKPFESLCKEYELILNNVYDSILVTDGKGKVLWFNEPTGQKDKLPAKLLGKTVSAIENEGLFFPSVAHLVLDDMQTHTILQNSSNDKRRVVTGTPVFDECGNMFRIVTISRDLDKLITDVENFDFKQNVCNLQVRFEEISQKTERVFSELRQLRKGAYFNKKLVGCVSRKMKAVMEQVENISMVDTTVLLLGESGVGKDVLATTIHQQSERKDGPFIRINCGAIPENLLESELFGYEAGSFTGANNKRKLGLFEIANGGTMFLDEIAEMPLNLQVKLLNVLQEKSFMRVGGSDSIHVNVRIISATNRDIVAMVREGKFREDLFYRLNVVPIIVPPLRERKEDLPVLIFHFLDTFNKKYKRNRQLSDEVMEALLAYEWPGNIRELENLMERLVVIGNSYVIHLHELPQNIFESKGKRFFDYFIDGDKIMPLAEAVQAFELKLINDAYKKYKSTAKVAEVLGVNRSTITRKLQKEDEY